jgi:hypothetical protein
VHLGTGQGLINQFYLQIQSIIFQTKWTIIIAQAEGGEEKRSFMQKIKNIMSVYPMLVYLLQNGGIEN